MIKAETAFNQRLLQRSTFPLFNAKAQSSAKTQRDVEVTFLCAFASFAALR
jgi:hypothetical protein